MSQSTSGQVNKQSFSQAPEWDLKNLYKDLNDAQIKIDLQDAKTSKEQFTANYKDKILANFSCKSFLAKAISDYEYISQKLAKLSTFAYLNKAKYSSDQEVAIFYQNLHDQVAEIESQLIFFTLEIKKIDETLLLAQIADDVDLQKYQAWLKRIIKFSKYYLSDSEEKILHLKSSTSSNFLIRLFDELHADLRYEFQGKMLSDNEIFNYLSSKIESERKEAALSIAKNLKQNGKTLSMILNMIAKDKQIEDNLRNFAQPISARNLINDIEDEVVENLVNSVKASYKKIAHRYYALKAKWMSKEKLEFWDRNAPLPFDGNRVFSWNESKEIVYRAFNKFSASFANEAKQFFDLNLIDAKIIAGKTSGAFCHPSVPETLPYMLMNFNGKVQDIMTLAHELGHCVHYSLSRNNGYLCSEIPLTLAETASVFAEQLVFRYMLELESDNNSRKAMIAKKVEDMINTVFRQIAFLDFELQIHKKRMESELSEEEIGQIWMQTQRDMLGDSINLIPEYEIFWSYISHFFHAPFYVYSYAFGDCLVNSLYKYYLSNQHNFVEKYLNLLRSGGTKHHSELLKTFDINLAEQNFFNGGLQMISELIDELEAF